MHVAHVALQMPFATNFNLFDYIRVGPNKRIISRDAIDVSKFIVDQFDEVEPRSTPIR